MSQRSSGGIAAFAIEKPHAVVVGCLLVTILGALSLVFLPKDLLPAADLPAVQILSFYAGMPVEHVEENLTARFERYTGQAIGMRRQESKSLVGVSVVKNFFGTGTDLNTAIAQTTSLVMSVLRRLPPGTQPPLIIPFDPMAAVPLALVAVGGPHTEPELYNAARYEVRNGVQAVSGAIAPTVMGGAERQVVVYVDPKKLEKFNFSPLRVMERLSTLNTFIPAGDVKVGSFDYQIVSNGLVDRIQDMDDFPLRSEYGTPVYLKDVGQAKDASIVQTNVVTIDGRPQVYVPVYRQPGANSIRVVDDIRKSMAALEKRLGGYSLTVVADQSSFIRHAIRSISEEALIGGSLAALLVLLFLGNPRATFGIVLSLPLSVLCAFLGLQASGQSVNAMTLGGLALSIGVLVDNSIVVLENIGQKLDAGLSPAEAAYAGASEVSMPVLSSTLATLVVFFPVVFLGGIVRVLFSALAKAVMFAMAGSYLASMTVMPLFASRALRAGAARDLPALLAAMQRFMARLTRAYGAALAQALERRGAVLAAVAAVAAAGVALAPRIGTELFPRADAGNFILELRRPSGTRIELTKEFGAQVERKLRAWIDPADLKMIILNAGVYYDFSAAFTPNSGPQDLFFNVELSETRRHTSQYYAKLLRERLPREFPGTEMGVELGGLLTSALNGGLRAPIDIQVEGPDFAKAHAIALRLAAEIKSIRGAVDVRVQQRLDAPQVVLDVDRKKAMGLGLTTDEVVKNVVSAVSGSTTFNPAIWVDPRSGIDYLLGVRFPEKEVSTLEQLAEIPITGREQNRSVPLKLLAKIGKGSGPSEINHANLRRVVDIFLDAQDRDIGGVSRDARNVIRRAALPEGYSAEIRGEISEMNAAVASLGGGFGLAAVLVYLILVVQFESFLLPAIIMASVPLGLVGISFMLALTGTYFSIQAAIGAIFMIGIAVANGVLLVEFISHHARSGTDLEGAIVRGAQARLRPILMTSLASILGLVPMAVGLGRGSEANIPLGRAVIGGQLLSTALTLFVVPVLYRIFARSVWREDAWEHGKRAVPALLLVALALAPARAAELSLQDVLSLAEKNSARLSASRFRATAAQSAVGSAKAGYLPTLEWDEMDSSRLPESGRTAGIGGLVGSPYRSGRASVAVARETLWDFGRTSNAVEAARRDADAAREDVAVSRLEADQAALAAYFECGRLRSQREDLDSLAREVRLVGKEVERFVGTGQTSVVARYLVDSQIEETETAQADYEAREAAVTRRLAVLTGLPETGLSCPGLPPGDAAPLPASSAASPFVTRAQDEAEAARARLAQSRSARMPKVLAAGTAGTLDAAGIGGRGAYAFAAGISLPLFDGLRTTREIERAAALADGKEKDVDAARQRLDVLNARYDEDIDSSRARLLHLGHELKLAQAGFDVAKKRYASLQGDVVDLREALRNLARARGQLNDARAELLTAAGSKALLNGTR